MSDVIVSISIPEALVDYLTDTAKRTGTSITEAICEAIELDRYVTNKQAEGCKVLIQMLDGDLYELVEDG